MGYESIPLDEYSGIEDALAAEVLDGNLLKMIERGGAYHCAVEYEGGGIGAVVVLELLWDGTRQFKALPEDVGPANCLCPFEILRLLTATQNSEANAWRERCWAWNSEVVNIAMAGPAEQLFFDVADRLNEEALGYRLPLLRPTGRGPAR